VSERAPDQASADRTQHRIDVIATVLLALATLATAWAGYQSSRWHSEQAKLQTKATASRIEAARSQEIADREAQVDVALFVQWVDAHTLGERELARFYRRRFSSRLAPAFNAWIETQPFEHPAAPPSPFVMREYSIAANQVAAADEAAADTFAADAVEDIQNADNYVLAVVLFAACLFFAGVSTRMHTISGQRFILALGCILFVGTLVWVTTFPVTVTT
jgi:hypothetical protein